MERAARLLKNAAVSSNLVTAEDLLRAAWPVAVGRIIASHTLRVRLVRSTLVVEVEDSTWQRQLNTLSSQILRRLEKVTGGCPATDLEFRVGVRRMHAARAESRLSPATAQTSFDESDAIRDPVFKKVYQLSRKKASA